LSIRFLIAATFAVLVFACAARAAGAAQTPAGFTSISVPGNTASRGDASARLSVVVWYPAGPGTAVQPIVVGPPQTPYFVEGEGAKDAPLASGPARLPLIVISHGTGGTAMDLAWLCAGLAARGYVVAAVNHPGNNALQAPTVAGNTVWWMRADDLSRVIDGVSASRFGPRIDAARIGAAGVSLGGYTVLVLAGARFGHGLLSIAGMPASQCRGSVAAYPG
jgi:predicted dienelactone hydrolase